MRGGRLLIPAALILAGTPWLAAADPVAGNPGTQRDLQKKATAAVEQTARHVTTSLRILTYQKLDPTAEQKVLDEVAGTLKKLTQEEMKAVLAHLETAIKAPDEATASGEQREAYQKHREVVASLRSILFRLDVLKSLDEAAKRYADAAKAEFGLHQRALRADALGDSPRVRNPNRQLSEEREQQGDGQTDLRNEVSNLVKQLGTLKSKLSPEQLDRLVKADAVARSNQLVGQMETALQSVNGKNFKGASELQLRISRELQAIAAALATPRDALTVLKETREKLEHARKAEEALKADTQALKEKDKSAQLNPQRADAQKADANQLADRQGLLEFDTREARKALETVSKELAAKLSPAESEMRRAQDELRDKKLDDAKVAEANAAEKLQDAVRELDKQIAAAEKSKSDPLTAAKKAVEEIEKLIKDQKAAKELTKANEKKPENLKPAADAQKDVAKKAEAAKDLPLPENPEVKKLLDEAAAQAADAAKDLAKKDAQDAQPKQDAAIKALEAAKKGLEEQAKAIEKRRDDIAKLEEAKEKLAELAKQENKVADAAKAQADKGDKAEPDANADLAKKQDALTPPTKDVAEAVKEAAPDAAAKIDDAAKSQEMAKADLAKNEPMKGAADAKDAAKKLDEAGKALDKALQDLQAKEIADQAALQPNKVDPADAAKQIAKALEQAKEAYDASKQAAANLDKPKPGEPKQTAAEKLADLQKALADKAAKADLPEAAKDAGEAAKALDKGDIPAALEAQQKAGDALAKADAAKPAGDKGDKPAGTPSAGELAKDQQKLMEATAALQKSAEATAEAKAALTQAQANAPMAVKPQLDQAAKQLDQAAKELGEGKPAEAGEAQQKAADQLTQALGALNAAAQAKGESPAEPGMGQEAKPGDRPGDKPGDRPGDKPGEGGKKPGDKGMKPGEGEEKNDGQANGDRVASEKLKKSTATGGANASKAGNFIDLQKMERDKVQQNGDAAFPAEFRELIKQYNMNIKKAAKPQTPAPLTPVKPSPPATPDAPKK